MASTSPPYSGAIIVMGVSGCGKTTLAQLLAQALGCPFIEGDTLHDVASVAKMAAGQPLTDDDRQPWLDRIGATLRDAVTTHRVAVAACSALKHSYRERLRSALAAPTVFILLDAPRDELIQRLQQRKGHYMPVSLLTSQLATLERPGESEQVLMLDARLTPQELQAASAAWLFMASMNTANAE